MTDLADVARLTCRSGAVARGGQPEPLPSVLAEAGQWFAGALRGQAVGV